MPKTKPKPPAKPDVPKPQRGHRGITDMQKRFAEHIAQGFDQTEAMRRAGSTAVNPAVTASKWMRLPKVLDYLRSLPQEQQQEEARGSRIATAIERQEFWTEVMRGRGEATFVTKEGLLTGPPDWGSRIRAAEALARAQGDFKDDDSSKVKPQVVINLPQRPMTPEEIEEARRANGNA
ncbi:terminase small subunit [Deinococcus petrolearius]|uniref:Terminase small subunit n=1 Tax=Deinococcus petrolearius TaxID=1751295 RepID=A0ABW1DF71_9DEIO